MLRPSLHRTLGFKLFCLICAVLLVTVSVNAWQNGRSAYVVLMLELQERALQNAKSIANAAGATLESWRNQLVVVTSGVSGMPPERYALVLGNFLAADPDFVQFEIFKADAAGTPVRLIKVTSPAAADERYLGEPQAAVSTRISARTEAWLARKLADGAGAGFDVANVAPEVGLPLLSLIMRFEAKGAGHVWSVLTVWQSRLYATLASADARSAVIVAADGALISASDVRQIQSTVRQPSSPLTAAIAAGAAASGFKEWREPDGKRSFGAYARIPRPALTVLTFADGEPAYRAVREVLLRSATLAGLLILLAMLLSYIATARLTRTLTTLVNATIRIADGDFKSRVPVSSRDEVGLLGMAVNHMGSKIEGLLLGRVEQARLANELQTARLVQESFFPEAKVESRALSIHSFFKPASECSGDWWGHYQIGEGIHLVYVGDATGHGVPAALVTAMAFAAAAIMNHSLAPGEPYRSPGELLNQFNRALCESGSKSLTMTLFVAIFDLGRGVVQFANAGHPFPVLIRRGEAGPDGSLPWHPSRRVDLRQRGSPLGIGTEITYQNSTHPLLAGDRIVFYTDGLLECTNARGDPWGKRRLGRLVETSSQYAIEDFKQAFVDAAFGHFGGHPTADDVTVVIVEVGQFATAKAAPGLEEQSA